LPPPGAALETQPMLAITVAGDRFALRIHELAGLARTGKIIAVPGPTKGLLGIMGFRGGILPVFSLATLLGYVTPAQNPWFVHCGSNNRVVLAFSEFEYSFQAALSDISTVEHGTINNHSREMVVSNGSTRPVISVPSILAAIKIRDVSA